jgi:ABC-type multidrug transport system fused ATPase/permease subunit
MLKKTFFTHVSPLIKLGQKRPLELRDLPELPSLWNPAAHLSGFEQLRASATGKNFIFQVLKVLAPQGRRLGWFIFLLLLFKIFIPILIHQLISAVGSVSRGEMTFSHGLLIALALCSTQLFCAVVGQHYIYHAVTSTQSAVNGLNQRIYDAVLFSKKITNKGQVINRASSDAESAGASLWAMGEVVQIVTTMIATTTLLFFYLGTAAFAPLVILALLVPQGRLFSKRFARVQGEIMNHRDERVGRMSQFLDGIKIIKSFVWEKFVSQEINKVRIQEERSWKLLAKYKSYSTASFIFASVLVSTVAFGVYLLQGKTLSAATAFTCLTLFSYLEPCLRQLPKLLGEVSSSFVSGKRISELLEEATQASPMESKSESISLSNVSFNFENHPSLFQNVNLKINKGESIAVVGAVGSGKSTLLKILLGELSPTEGMIQVPRVRKAYVPQDPFLFQGTLEENISLGHSLHDQDYLTKALFASCLDHDLEFMPNGLATFVSENGGNLSGGQRQRVNLARAALHAPEVILMDDPLSALDPLTEKQIITRLIFGMWNQQTRIVSTHRLKYLSKFDRILYVEEGRIWSGTFSELYAVHKSFRQFCSEHQHADAEEEALISNSPQKAPALMSSGQSFSGSIEPEVKGVGEVSLKLYWTYFKAMSRYSRKGLPLTLALLSLTALSAMAMPIVQNKWLAKWTQDLGSENHFSHLFIYAGIGFLTLIVCAFQHYYWSVKAVDAAQSLHTRALDGVLSTVLRYFDANPTGRILNRFSRDLDAVEKDLSWSLEDSFMALLNSIGAVLVMISALPFMAVVVLPVAAVYYVLQKSYRGCMRETKRLMSVARSPRISTIQEALDGAAVIRCFKAESFFKARFTVALKDYQTAFYGVVLINRWFSIRIPLVSSLLSFTAAVGIIYLGGNGKISEGIAGMALVYAFRFWDSLNWTVRAFGEAEAQMTSVERLDQLAILEKEVDRKSSGNKFRGDIDFKDVVAGYAPHLPDVLKGTSFSVKAGTKVGVIGRTGAGKSTLFSLLHRFIEPRAGEILIDDCDIRNFSLSELRQGIAMIPQSPILFAGTIRSNLDPQGIYEDEELLQVLKKAHVNFFLRSGLDDKVSESGSNFSRGQRQLLCLARALLRQTQIIIVDEASASVDARTDFLIRDVLMKECDGVTVLIIAHKPESVSECDVIIEMKDGRVLSTSFNRPLVPQIDEVASSPFL